MLEGSYATLGGNQGQGQRNHLITVNIALEM